MSMYSMSDHSRLENLAQDYAKSDARAKSAVENIPLIDQFAYVAEINPFQYFSKGEDGQYFIQKFSQYVGNVEKLHDKGVIADRAYSEIMSYVRRISGRLSEMLKLYEGKEVPFEMAVAQKAKEEADQKIQAASAKAQSIPELKKHLQRLYM